MLEPEQIILKPLIFSEKANILKDKYNQFVFIVHPCANKIQIRQAVEKMFGVKVLQVRTMITRGHMGRMGMRYGKRPNKKKAIVTLAQGQKIDLFG